MTETVSNPTPDTPHPTPSGAAPSPRMPSPVELVTEAIDTFAVEPSRSTLLQLDRQTLIDVALILCDPARDAYEGFKFLQEELGPDVVSKSAYYRLAPEIRHRFDRVRAAHRLRIARWQIGQQIQDGELREVIQAHMTRLVAETVVSADDLAKLEGKEQGTIIAMLEGWTRANLKQQELELRRQEGERKEQKLEADLAKAEELLRKQRAENDEREQKRQQAAAKVKESLARPANGTGTLSREDVIQMIDQVMRGEAA